MIVRWQPYIYTSKLNGKQLEFRCSACKKFHFHNGEMTRKYKFCPECGTKMDMLGFDSEECQDLVRRMKEKT